MHVSIHQSVNTSGFLWNKRTYCVVAATVAFSDEETGIIKKRHLEDAVVMERRRSADIAFSIYDVPNSGWLRVRHLLKGQTNSYLLANPSAAKTYDVQLRGALTKLKEYIADNAEVGIIGGK